MTGAAWAVYLYATLALNRSRDSRKNRPRADRAQRLPKRAGTGVTQIGDKHCGPYRDH
jgi:hypothetical protein